MGSMDKQTVLAHFLESVDTQVPRWDYQRNSDQILVVTRDLMEVGEKTKVECSEQFQVQHLYPQAIEDVLEEILQRTLQYQTTKGNYEMDPIIQPQ